MKKIFITLLAVTVALSSSMTALAAPRTLDAVLFDPEYYAQYNPDVVAELGNDCNLLYNHYMDTGKAEGRIGCFNDTILNEKTVGNYTLTKTNIWVQAAETTYLYSFPSSDSVMTDRVLKKGDIVNIISIVDGTDWYRIVPQQTREVVFINKAFLIPLVEASGDGEPNVGEVVGYNVITGAPAIYAGSFDSSNF